MKVTLVFVPPDGGEADYSLDFDLPGVPQPGDYISITRPEEQGISDFIVRKSLWHLAYPGNEQSIVVECEFAKGPFSTENHVRSCEMYKSRKGKLREFEDTAY
jgi:hypothetical protein